ncbi:SETMAR [Cordylochernes scorpioides]|uniref:SETMAR n=1 Tax=Cordylochernes scorpioides TaxID=51811 RepID=A0ABY6LRF3_9ARAC|nr:SETMAR [Cordylochernes scorpioides]
MESVKDEKRVGRPILHRNPENVLDLFMVSPALLELVLDLSIESLPYSDHLPLLLKLNGSDNTKAKSLPLEYIPVKKFTWSINKASTYELCLEDLNALQLLGDASIDLCADTLTSRIQTSMWSKTIIQPIFKNGDPNAPSNYRGIALISNLSKLFTSILKNRLSNWIENRKLIAENQAGFRRGYSCQDHIFTLTSLIQMTLSHKRRKLYAFFVDLKKAFDTVPHLLLWRKLALVGLSGRFIKLIQNYYAQMMGAVRWNGSFTEFIKIQSGVLQGEPLTPYLFIIFINDLVATLDDSDLPGLDVSKSATFNVDTLLGSKRLGHLNVATTLDDMGAVALNQILDQPARSSRIEAYGKHALSIKSCEYWFRRFKSGDFDTRDKERGGRPIKFEDAELEALLDEDSSQTQEELAETLGVTQQAISNRLKVMGMVQKQGNWVPYELKPGNIERHIFTCKLLLKRQNRKGFLHRIVTGDEKWIPYDNPKRKKSWVKPGHASTSTAKPNIHGKKLMLCIWWDQLRVIYYELLQPNETITGEHYQQQLMQLSRALKIKRPLYAKRHDKVIYQHDNAWPHVAKVVKETLEVLQWDVLPHPAYSPDIAPSYYHMFRSMTHGLAEQHFTSYEEAKNWVNVWIASKDEEFFRHGIRMLPERWKKFVAKDGQYFE